MAEAGYKQLVSYRLAAMAFNLGWQIVPLYYKKYEDSRQRDQIKQALRSTKQNIVEGSTERSLSSKLKLYDVAKASCMEALEDFEDILCLEQLSCWTKADARIRRLRLLDSNPPNPPYPSIPSVLQRLGVDGDGLGGRDGLEGLVNYQIDLLIRCGYLLDRQIRAVEQKHEREGGYRENLLKKRIAYRSVNR